MEPVIRESVRGHWGDFYWTKFSGMESARRFVKGSGVWDGDKLSAQRRLISEEYPLSPVEILTGLDFISTDEDRARLNWVALATGSSIVIRGGVEMLKQGTRYQCR